MSSTLSFFNLLRDDISTAAPRPFLSNPTDRSLISAQTLRYLTLPHPLAAPIAEPITPTEEVTSNLVTGFGNSANDSEQQPSDMDYEKLMG